MNPTSEAKSSSCQAVGLYIAVKTHRSVLGPALHCAIGLLCLTVVGCSMGSADLERRSRNSPTEDHRGESDALWNLISTDPPTYYPKGISQDAPTSYHYGEWIEAGAEHARWFIPKGGSPGHSTSELREDALARRTTAQKLRRPKELAIRTVIRVPFNIIITALAGFGGLMYDPEKEENPLAELWRSTYD